MLMFHCQKRQDLVIANQEITLIYKMDGHGQKLSMCHCICGQNSSTTAVYLSKVKGIINSVRLHD